MTGPNKPTAESVRQAMILENAKRQVPTNVRRTLAKAALDSQVLRRQKNYYSTVRFAFDVTVPAAVGQPHVYALPKGKKLVAFSYSNNEVAEMAGFDRAYGPVTEAETNLVQKHTGGATVYVFGISLYLGELSDTRLAKHVWANTFVDISLDGSNRYALLGRMGRIPSAGGLYGMGESWVTQPDAHAATAHVGTASNGVPQADNFFRLAEPIKWNPVSREDSQFQVRFELARTISVQALQRQNIGGHLPFNPPANEGDVGTYVDVTVYLHTIEYQPRSKQQ